MSMNVRFWGTRGSFPALGPGHARYGGDTSCVAVTCGSRTLVFDAGSGMARFGASIPGTAEIDLFLSHFHLDHIMGLAYFAPIWRAGTVIRIWLEEGVADTGRAAIEALFGPPFHPVTLAYTPADILWRTYRVGAPFSPHPGIEIVTHPLPHPGGATGARLTYDGACVVYGADTGALVGTARASALQWAHEAELLILDATFTCAESEARTEWGHMSWKEAAAFGVEAGARSIALYHHAPDRTDDQLDRIASEARAISEHTFLARDGLIADVRAAVKV